MLLLEGDKFSSSAREGGGKPLSWPWGGGRVLGGDPRGQVLGGVALYLTRQN